MEQSLESLERVRTEFSGLAFGPYFDPFQTKYNKKVFLKILPYLFQERDFYFEKLRDIELMITNIAGEEAETPADPDSDLGQMSKKVCRRIPLYFDPNENLKKLFREFILIIIMSI